MTTCARFVLVSCCVLAAPMPMGSMRAADVLQPGGRVWLHAHNCYPEKGLWSERIDRALATRTTGLAIEQDIAWRVDPQSGRGQSVVSHDLKFTGTEPTLEAHFFDKVRPLIARALAENKRETWPVMVLHLDFKSNEPAHHQAIWELLGRHESWLTTAERVADETRVTPFRVGPLLVLTENGDGQADTFHARVPVGGSLRIFGTIPPATFPSATTSEERAAAVFNAAPEVLIPTRATNYRRWTNFAWAAVELGGQGKAGAWTAADARSPQGDRVPRPRHGPVGALLHAEWPPAWQEPRLDRELQLRLGGRRPGTSRGGGRRRRRVHRDRSVRGARRGAWAEEIVVNSQRPTPNFQAESCEATR